MQNALSKSIFMCRHMSRGTMGQTTFQRSILTLFHDFFFKVIEFELFVKTYTVNIYRYKAIGANATSSVISTTSKCISSCLEILQLLLVILQGLMDYLQELQDFQTGANAFTGLQNYTGCCISPYSFVPINIYSVKG